jgi:hypothetical protein
MGFFGSFSKKKESSPFSLSDLPPPPKASAKIDAAPLPEHMFLPPPPEPTEFKLSVPTAPLMPPPIQKLKEPEHAAPPIVFLPELPKKTEPQMQIKIAPVKNAPDALPLIPKSQTRLLKQEEELGEFSDTYEEVPFFNDDDAETVLPVLNLSDTEEDMNFKPAIDTKKPLFIRTDHYSNILSVVDSVNDYVAVSSDTIYSLENIKKNTEVEHNKYKSVMEDLQRKLIYIDKVLFEKGVQ